MIIPILDLKPTQFALGMLEVKKNAKKYSKLSNKELAEEVKKKRIQAVKAPNGDIYLVDGHHHACVFWLLGIKQVRIKIIKDYSKKKISYEKFWKEMTDKKCCHLYDQFGDGPRDPIYLPKDIRGLGDDPYRSLAWLVEKNGGYKKTKERFSDFKWSNFFRNKKLIPKKFDQNLKKISRVAEKLAHRSEAKSLPGYVPKMENNQS